MKFIEVEYNQELKPLETVLSAVKRPGDFFVSVAVRQRSINAVSTSICPDRMADLG